MPGRDKHSSLPHYGSNYKRTRTNSRNALNYKSKQIYGIDPPVYSTTLPSCAYHAFFKEIFLKNVGSVLVVICAIENIRLKSGIGSHANYRVLVLFPILRPRVTMCMPVHTSHVYVCAYMPCVCMHICMYLCCMYVFIHIHSLL